jgi:hypothetical protein
MAKLYFGSVSALGKTTYAYLLTYPDERWERDVTDRSRIVAEYDGLNKGLRVALNQNVRDLVILGPKLVINQLRGNAPIKSSKAVILHNHTRELLMRFRKVKLNSIPYTKNKAFFLSLEYLKEFFEGKAIAKSKEIPDRKIKKIQGLKFKVNGIVVDLSRQNCSCNFFSEANNVEVKTGGVVIRCKHIFAAERFVSIIRSTR